MVQWSSSKREEGVVVVVVNPYRVLEQAKGVVVVGVMVVVVGYSHKGSMHDFDRWRTPTLPLPLP